MSKRNTIRNNDRIQVISNTTTQATSLNNIVALSVPERYSIQQLVADGQVALPAETFKGFGYREVVDGQYTDQAPLEIPGTTPTLLTCDQATDVDQLRGAFSTFRFFHDDKIWCKNQHDTFIVRLSFQLRSLVLDNVCSIDLAHTSLIENQRFVLSNDVGEPEKITATFFVRASSTLYTNGASLRVRTDFDSELWGVKIIFLPMGSGV